jgi:hypothetical protein
VNRESQVLIGVGALAAIGLLIAIVAESPLLGVAVIAIGLIGGIVYLRATRPDQSDPFADARSEADETNVGNLTPNEPLTAWAPDGGLGAWTPPAGLAPPVAPPAAPVEPTYAPLPEPSTNWDDTSWGDSVTWEAPQHAAPAEPSAIDANPLNDLIGLESMDPIAEVERIEERESLPYEPVNFDHMELDVHGNPVNEAVKGADDIMAASQATELHLADGEQTELQKLLAKVQIRLSAYE